MLNKAPSMTLHDCLVEFLKAKGLDYRDKDNALDVLAIRALPLWDGIHAKHVGWSSCIEYVLLENPERRRTLAEIDAEPLRFETAKRILDFIRSTWPDAPGGTASPQEESAIIAQEPARSHTVRHKAWHVMRAELV